MDEVSGKRKRKRSRKEVAGSDCANFERRQCIKIGEYVICMKSSLSMRVNEEMEMSGQKYWCSIIKYLD